MSADPSRTPHLTGGCQCGAVRYALYTAPAQISLCHCRMCQKALGAPFGVFVTIDTKDFAWTRGQPASWASSTRALRDFCANCGTPLAFRPTEKAIIELMGGTLDQPAVAQPTYEVGREAKLAWLANLASLPGRTTEENMGAAGAAAVASFQHPDHD